VTQLVDEQYQFVAVDSGNVRHVATVFRSVYGEDFHARDVYDPALLWKKIQAGQIVSALAFSADGQPAGYISLFKNAPNPRLWETGNIVIVPGKPDTDLSLRLFRYYEELISSRAADMDGFFTEAVCSHYFTQKSGAESGMVDCGLELDQLDGSSFKDGKSNKAGSARVSCVLSFKEKIDQTGPVYVPVRYEGILRKITGSLRPRDLFLSTAGMPVQGTSTREERYYPASRTWKLSFRDIGSDWITVVEDIVRQARQREVISLQITINIALPYVGEAVEVLRENGFFFGGMVPLWFGTDGLLMQQLFGTEPHYEEVKLYTPMAKGLLAYIKIDRQTVRENCGSPSSDTNNRE
jgi:hypothetical protein